MKQRLIKIARFLAYPAVYVFFLGLFGYLTFPIDRLKDRIIAEFDRTAKPGQRLEIDKLGTHWFSGVTVTGMRLTLPGESGPTAPFAAPGPPGKDSVIVVEEGHARVRILPLILGRVRVDFWASVLGGEVEGTIPVGSGSGDVEVELSKIEVGKVELLSQVVGLPIRGTISGKLQISPVDGKFTKASGALDLSVADIVVGDGKAKIAGMLELPAAKLGTLTLNAEAKDGVLKITKLTAPGADLELIGDGRIAIREPAMDSGADLYLKFKFTDAYRGKNDTTKSLLGEPGASLPGLLEMQEPKMKRAKRPDDFYGFHVYGPLKKLKFDPSAAEVNFSNPVPGTTSAAKTSPRKALDLKKPGGLSFPLGGSQAKPTRDEDTAPPTPAIPQPVITPPTRTPRPETPEIKLPEPKQPEIRQPEKPLEVHVPEPPPPPQEQPPPEQPAPEQPPAELPAQ